MWNHLFSIAFSVNSTHKDWGDTLMDANERELLRASLSRRVIEIFDDADTYQEAIEYADDTYEMQSTHIKMAQAGSAQDTVDAVAVLDLLEQHLDLGALVSLIQTRLEHASKRDIQDALDTARERGRDFAVSPTHRRTWQHLAILLRQQIACF